MSTRLFIEPLYKISHITLLGRSPYFLCHQYYHFSVVHSVQVPGSLSICKQTPKELMWLAEGLGLFDKAQKAGR